MGSQSLVQALRGIAGLQERSHCPTEVSLQPDVPFEAVQGLELDVVEAQRHGLALHVAGMCPFATLKKAEHVLQGNAYSILQ